MRDLNFFEPYIEKREFKFDRMILLYTILVLSIIGSAIFALYNSFQIRSLNRDVADRIAIAENPATVQKVEEIKALETEVNTFREEVDRIIELDKNIEAKDIIGEELLSKVRAAMPPDLFLTSFSANGRDVNISGVSRDTYSIAEFGKGLELIEEAETLFLSGITGEEDYYNFDLNLTLKDVSIDGSQQDEEQQIEDETANQE